MFRDILLRYESTGAEYSSSDDEDNNVAPHRVLNLNTTACDTRAHIEEIVSEDADMLPEAVSDESMLQSARAANKLGLGKRSRRPSRRVGAPPKRKARNMASSSRKNPAATTSTDSSSMEMVRRLLAQSRSSDRENYANNEDQLDSNRTAVTPVGAVVMDTHESYEHDSDPEQNEGGGYSSGRFEELFGEHTYDELQSREQDASVMREQYRMDMVKKAAQPWRRRHSEENSDYLKKTEEVSRRGRLRQERHAQLETEIRRKARERKRRQRKQFSESSDGSTVTSTSAVQHNSPEVRRTKRRKKKKKSTLSRHSVVDRNAPTSTARIEARRRASTRPQARPNDDDDGEREHDDGFHEVHDTSRSYRPASAPSEAASPVDDADVNFVQETGEVVEDAAEEAAGEASPLDEEEEQGAITSLFHTRHQRRSYAHDASWPQEMPDAEPDHLMSRHFKPCLSPLDAELDSLRASWEPSHDETSTCWGCRYQDHEGSGVYAKAWNVLLRMFMAGLESGSKICELAKQLHEFFHREVLVVAEQLARETYSEALAARHAVEPREESFFSDSDSAGIDTELESMSQSEELARVRADRPIWTVYGLITHLLYHNKDPQIGMAVHSMNLRDAARILYANCLYRRHNVSGRVVIDSEAFKLYEKTIKLSWQASRVDVAKLPTANRDRRFVPVQAPNGLLASTKRSIAYSSHRTLYRGV